MLFFRGNAKCHTERRLEEIGNKHPRSQSGLDNQTHQQTRLYGNALIVQDLCTMRRPGHPGPQVPRRAIHRPICLRPWPHSGRRVHQCYTAAPDLVKDVQQSYTLKQGRLHYHVLCYQFHLSERAPLPKMFHDQERPTSLKAITAKQFAPCATIAHACLAALTKVSFNWANTRNRPCGHM